MIKMIIPSQTSEIVATGTLTKRDEIRKCRSNLIHETSLFRSQVNLLNELNFMVAGTSTANTILRNASPK